MIKNMNLTSVMFFEKSEFLRFFGLIAKIHLFRFFLRVSDKMDVKFAFFEQIYPKKVIFKKS